MDFSGRVGAATPPAMKPACKRSGQGPKSLSPDFAPLRDEERWEAVAVMPGRNAARMAFSLSGSRPPGAFALKDAVSPGASGG